jgi:hypothetical protein
MLERTKETETRTVAATAALLLVLLAAAPASGQDRGKRAAGKPVLDEGIVLGPANVDWRLDPRGLRRVPLGVPQLLVDDHLIENRFDEKFISSTVPHVLHAPQRTARPILDADRPWEMGLGVAYPSVVFDAEANTFRMYYMVYHEPMRQPGYPPGGYFLAYAESDDGLAWTKPVLGLHPWAGSTRTNIVMVGERETNPGPVYAREAAGEGGGRKVRNLLALPEASFQGHRFLILHGDREHYLGTSEDGIHWLEKRQMILPLRIDAYQTIVWDDALGEFVAFVRNKVIFGDRNKPREIWGNVRAVSRVGSPALWAVWDTVPVAVMLPDAEDASRFYEMPVFRYGGVYFGLLHQTGENPQSIDVELVTSRDGFEWRHVPGRGRLVTRGVRGAWDFGMVFAGAGLLEVADEWWVYYAGFRGYHDDRDNRSAIGLLRFRKEGFVSVRAGDSESTLLTRPFVWPGGVLAVNARAPGGSLQVRATDPKRKEIEGFGYGDGDVFSGDEVRRRIRWKNADIRTLAGRLIRLEFKFRRADIFAFVALER